MPQHVETEGWEGIAQKLRTSGRMKEEDISIAGKLGKTVYALDKIAFSTEPPPIVFDPSRANPSSPGKYVGIEDKLEKSENIFEEYYTIYVDNLCNDLSALENKLKVSWPKSVVWTIDQNLCLYSLAAQLVRLRAQGKLLVSLFSPSHVGKITKIPILNKVIESCALIFGKEKIRDIPKSFDSYVIGSFAAQMLGENKRDGLSNKDQMVKIIAELVKLDAKEV